MVKVIVNKSGWKWAFKCRGKDCGSELEATSADVRQTTDEDARVLYVVCPLCKSWNYVPVARQTPVLEAALDARKARKKG